MESGTAVAVNQQGLITFGTGTGDATANLQVNDSVVGSLAIPGSPPCSPSTIGLPPLQRTVILDNLLNKLAAMGSSVM